MSACRSAPSDDDCAAFLCSPLATAATSIQIKALTVRERKVDFQQVAGCPREIAAAHMPTPNLAVNLSYWLELHGGGCGLGRGLNDRSFSMCDYSLHEVQSRPAKVGDRLVSTQFWNTTTQGFSAVGEPDVAVCLLAGTEIAFDSDVRRKETGFFLSFFKKEPRVIPHRVARFRQVNLDNPCTHHDAVEFPDGCILLLTHLCVGQHATVLQLPAAQTAGRTLAEVRADARNGA
jgi:hypothetical protein